MLAFHDFLVEYKQTPKSKMFKRHIPQMSGIAEEASFYEQSMIDVSSRQQQTYPTSQTIQSAINVESDDEEISDEEDGLHHSNVFVYSTIDVRSNPPTSGTLSQQQVNSPK